MRTGPQGIIGKPGKSRRGAATVSGEVPANEVIGGCSPLRRQQEPEIHKPGDLLIQNCPMTVIFRTANTVLKRPHS